MYGGQAVIEGVMMRGRDRMAVAVRAPNGEVIIHEETLHSASPVGLAARVPFLRGIATLAEALTVGRRALLWSAKVAMGEQAATFDDEAGPAMTVASLGLSAALMFAAPAAGSSFIERRLGIHNWLLANLLEGGLRLGIIAGYVTAIAQVREGRRLFQYHGAEHKTINAYEAGAPLTPESVQQFPLEHPRCGTAFLMTVALINVALGILIGKPPLLTRVALRLLLLPVTAALAYEFIRYSARHMDNPAVRVLVIPNLWMQRLTTREPDLTMLEVSINALERVLSR